MSPLRRMTGLLALTALVGGCAGRAGEGGAGSGPADGLSSGGGDEGSGGGDGGGDTGGGTRTDGGVVPPAPPLLTSLEELCKLISNRNQDDPTANDTHHRFNLRGTDLGIPVAHGNDVFFFFGDSAGAAGIWPLGPQSLPDAVGYSAVGAAALAADPKTLCSNLAFLALSPQNSVGPKVDATVQRDFAAGAMAAPAGGALVRLHPQPRRRSRQEPVPAAPRRLRGADGRLLLRRRALSLLLERAGLADRDEGLVPGALGGAVDDGAAGLRDPISRRRALRRATARSTATSSTSPPSSTATTSICSAPAPIARAPCTWRASGSTRSPAPAASSATTRRSSPTPTSASSRCATTPPSIAG